MIIICDPLHKNGSKFSIFKIKCFLKKAVLHLSLWLFLILESRYK